jgi:hypothetical protein
MSDLLNFGFSPTGTALGSEGSPSMPMDEYTGLEDPMLANEQSFDSFVQQTQRRYGEVSDINGSIYDPRGDNALSSKPSDYKTTDMMRPDEVAVRMSASEDQLYGGDPVLAPYIPDSSGFAQALFDRDIGFSQQGAGTLAESLSSYDPAILDGIKIPPQVEPQVTNKLGLTTQYGGLPDAFFDPNSGVVKQGVPEAVERVISQSAEYQYVDQNGVVNKYAPGTDPYTAMSRGLLAGNVPGTAPGSNSRLSPTPAQIRAYPGKIMSSPVGPSGGTTRAGGGAGNGAPGTSGAPNTSGNSLNNSGAPVPVEGETLSSGANVAKSSRSSGSGSSYYIESSGYVDAEVPTEDEVAGGKKCSKWWWLLALIPVAGAVYYKTRGKKRGKRK